MEIRQLQYFIAMYEEGSATRAAQRLNVVQPAVSQQLAKLEAELGQLLFHRIPKGLVPTPAGIDAYRLLQPIVQDLSVAQEELSVSEGQVKGHLAIGFVGSVANNALCETLLHFNQKYPGITVQATGGYTVELLDMLHEAKLDLAIVNAPTKTAAYELDEILTEDFALICSSDHPSKFDRAVRLGDLCEQELVLPSSRHGLRDAIESALSRRRRRLRPRLEIDDLSTIENFVGQSRYVTLLPPITVQRALLAGRLRMHKFHPRITRKIVCASIANRRRSKAAELFIEVLREFMSETMVRLSEPLRRRYNRP